ncbi:MAG: nicotinamide mononucleotide transporter [Gammaproteobacteria bacterium]
MDILQFIVSQFHETSAWEVIAVFLAIAYLLLAVQENILCWYCALFSTAIFIFLFWNVSLLMESALNVFYLIMAIYGWQQWKYGGTKKSGVLISTLEIRQNVIIIGVILVITLVSGWLLAQHTEAAWPYVDSFTTWASVITTVMVAKKILENWLYWLVIDSVSIPLYIDRGLHLTAFLFLGYLVIVIFGYFKWRGHLSEQQTLAAPA